jgi:ribosomal protein S4
MKGIKLSIKDKNLYYAKLSYKYAKGIPKALQVDSWAGLPQGEQNKLDSLSSGTAQIQKSGQSSYRIPKGLVSKDKILVERNITGFTQINTIVKEEWKSRFVSKQLLKSYYNLSDKEYKDLWKTLFSKYGSDLIELLETRLDVILFRLGYTKSLGESHNLIKHGLIHITNSKGYWKSRPVSYSKIFIEPGTLIGLSVNKLISISNSKTIENPLKEEMQDQAQPLDLSIEEIKKDNDKSVIDYKIYNQILVNKIRHNMCNRVTISKNVERHKKNEHKPSRACLGPTASLNWKYSWLSTFNMSLNQSLDSSLENSLNQSFKDNKLQQNKGILSIGVLWNKPKFEEVLLPITLNTKKL